MLLKDVPIGSRVKMYTDKDGEYIRNEITTYTVEAWVLGLHTNSDLILLGWKQGEQCPDCAWKHSGRTVQMQSGEMPSDFIAGYWMSDTYMVVGIVGSAAAVSSVDPNHKGMFCRGCRNWYDYAVPNRPSGNLVCWSCRQNFVPEDW